MRRNVLAVLLLAGVALAQSSPAASSQSKEDQKPGTTLKVDVRLVSIYATVTDARGAPIGGLTKENFSVTEDGKPQKITVFARESEQPLSIVLAIDSSSSTRKDLSLEMAAAKRFVHAIVRPQDSLAVYEFSSAVNEIVPFTSKLDRIDRGLREVRPGGATALYDAIFLGADALNDREGRKVLVIISDGGDTASSTSYQDAVRAAQVADTMVYSIIDLPVINDPGRNTAGEHAMIQISNDTGGKWYYEGSVAELEKTFDKISEELRTQYLLGYYSSQKYAASDFRTVDVAVRLSNAAEADTKIPDGLQIRHRKGYYTSKLK